MKSFVRILYIIVVLAPHRNEELVQDSVRDVEPLQEAEVFEHREEERDKELNSGGVTRGGVHVEVEGLEDREVVLGDGEVLVECHVVG